jgi:DsbC/DsbD-like thiol-disulfide interchange protein
MGDRKRPIGKPIINGPVMRTAAGGIGRAPAAAAITAAKMTLVLLTVLPIFAYRTSAQDAAGKPEEPVTWTAALDKSSTRPMPGGELNVAITASIKDGWHLYSTEEPKGGPRPTVISLPAGQPFEIAGDIDSGIPETALDDNFGLKTDYYEGSATFTFPVKIAATATPGRQKLQVEVRYQSCTKQLCMPPTTAKLEIPVEVGPAR